MYYKKGLFAPLPFHAPTLPTRWDFSGLAAEAKPCHTLSWGLSVSKASLRICFSLLQSIFEQNDSSLLVFASARCADKLQGMWSKPGTGARHTEASTGVSRDWLPVQPSVPTPDQKPRTLYAVGSNSSLRADVSFGERTQMVFMLSSFLEWFLIQCPVPRGVGTQQGHAAPEPRRRGSGVEEDVQRQVYNRVL